MISQSVVKPVKRRRIFYFIHILKWLHHNIEYIYIYIHIYYQYLDMWYKYYLICHAYTYSFRARLAINTCLSFVPAQPMLASAMRPGIFTTPGFVMSDLVIRTVYDNLNQSHLPLQKDPRQGSLNGTHQNKQQIYGNFWRICPKNYALFRLVMYWPLLQVERTWKESVVEVPLLWGTLIIFKISC